jgi:hypothetical protein
VTRWSEEQLAEHLTKQGKAAPAASTPKARPLPKVASREGVKPPAPANPKAALYALGRLKTGHMNRTEERYAQHLEALRAAGEVLWWKFEGMKLRLADLTFITPDFVLMAADGRLEFHDCKGDKAIVEDDARAKTKIAADQFPCVFKLVYPRKKKDGGGWEVEVIR